MTRRTKIVATIGPASDSPDQLRALIEAGIDVARLGFAHGTVDDQLARLRRVRDAAKVCGRHIGVLADLPGPKVRTGPLPEGGVFLAEDDVVALAPGGDPGSATRIAIEYPSLLEDVREGDDVWLGDGAVRLTVERISDWAAHATVTHGGRIQGRPGVHLPAERMRIDVPTERDLELLEVVSQAGVDFAAVSFVRGADDMRRARAAAPDGLMLVAKIETRAACDNLDGIIDVADAVMVARGDLGVECPIEEIPHLQKQIIRTCVAYGRPVITATQVLESMVHAPMPTRAEATDVANAVFDGTDALMLSGETAIGHNPVAAVRAMARIAARAEIEADYLQWGGRLGRLQRQAELDEQLLLTAAMTHAAWQAIHDAGATAVLCCTRSGTTARAMARFRPSARLLGVTPDERTARQLALTWGAIPITVPELASNDEMLSCAIEAAKAEGHVESGDVVALLTGVPGGAGIDALRLVRVH